MIYGSTEYVRAQITADVSLVSTPVNMALIPLVQEPDDDTIWHPAEWDPDTVKYPSTVRLLVGKRSAVGAVDYPRNRYSIYIDVVTAEEEPWLRAGTWVIE